MNQHAIHKQIEQRIPLGNLFSKGHNFRRWKEDVDCDLEELIFKRLVVTQFWIHRDFLKCYFISIIIYKNPKKIKKKKNSKIYFSRVNRIFP
jgi:hypothetical protein